MELKQKQFWICLFTSIWKSTKNTRRLKVSYKKESFRSRRWRNIGECSKNLCKNLSLKWLRNCWLSGNCSWDWSLSTYRISQDLSSSKNLESNWRSESNIVQCIKRSQHHKSAKNHSKSSTTTAQPQQLAVSQDHKWTKFIHLHKKNWL